MNINIKSYEDFANKYKKYDGSMECFVQGCNKPAYYEGGDVRFYCGMCDELSGVKKKYRIYLENIEKSIRIRMLWDKDDTTLKPLYDEVVNKLLKAKINESSQ